MSRYEEAFFPSPKDLLAALLEVDGPPRLKRLASGLALALACCAKAANFSRSALAGSIGELLLLEGADEEEEEVEVVAPEDVGLLLSGGEVASSAFLSWVKYRNEQREGGVGGKGRTRSRPRPTQPVGRIETTT